MQRFMMWLGQVTTGHGFMILGSTITAAATGQMPWSMAAPLIAGGVVGLVWPENTKLVADAQVIAQDGVNMAQALRRGMPILLLGIGLAALAACTTAQRQLACKIDSTLHPVAADVAELLVPGATTSTIVSTDQLLVHPAVVAYCASLNGTPAVTAPVVTAPVVKPTS